MSTATVDFSYVSSWYGKEQINLYFYVPPLLQVFYHEVFPTKTVYVCMYVCNVIISYRGLEFNCSLLCWKQQVPVQDKMHLMLINISRL